MTLKVNYGYFSGVGGIAGNGIGLGEVCEALACVSGSHFAKPVLYAGTVS